MRGIRGLNICYKSLGRDTDDQIDIFGTRFDFPQNHGSSQGRSIVEGDQNDPGWDGRDPGFFDRHGGLACSLLESSCGFPCGVVTIQKRFVPGVLPKMRGIRCLCW